MLCFVRDAVLDGRAEGLWREGLLQFPVHIERVQFSGIGLAEAAAGDENAAFIAGCTSPARDFEPAHSGQVQIEEQYIVTDVGAQMSPGFVAVGLVGHLMVHTAEEGDDGSSD